MRRLLRQIAHGAMDLVDGTFSGLDEPDLGIAPLAAAQQPVRDHVEVAPDRADLSDRFAQLGKFILRERDGMLELLPDQGNDPALRRLPGCFCKRANAPHFMRVQPQVNLAALAAVSAGTFTSCTFPGLLQNLLNEPPKQDGFGKAMLGGERLKSDLGFGRADSFEDSQGLTWTSCIRNGRGAKVHFATINPILH